MSYDAKVCICILAEEELLNQDHGHVLERTIALFTLSLWRLMKTMTCFHLLSLSSPG